MLCADASSEELSDEVSTVRQTLAESLGDEALAHKSVVLCLNKGDLLSAQQVRDLVEDYPEAVMISARPDAGALLEAIYDAIAESHRRMSILIPHAEYGKAASLYGKAEIHDSESTVEGTWMDVTLPKSISGEYAHFRVA